MGKPDKSSMVCDGMFKGEAGQVFDGVRLHGRPPARQGGQGDAAQLAAGYSQDDEARPQHERLLPLRARLGEDDAAPVRGSRGPRRHGDGAPEEQVRCGEGDAVRRDDGAALRERLPVAGDGRRRRGAAVAGSRRRRQLRQLLRPDAGAAGERARRRAPAAAAAARRRRRVGAQLGGGSAARDLPDRRVGQRVGSAACGAVGRVPRQRRAAAGVSRAARERRRDAARARLPRRRRQRQRKHAAARRLQELLARHLLRARDARRPPRRQPGHRAAAGGGGRAARRRERSRCDAR